MALAGASRKHQQSFTRASVWMVPGGSTDLILLHMVGLSNETVIPARQLKEAQTEPPHHLQSDCTQVFHFSSTEGRKWIPYFVCGLFSWFFWLCQNFNQSLDLSISTETKYQVHTAFVTCSFPFRLVPELFNMTYWPQRGLNNPWTME